MENIMMGEMSQRRGIDGTEQSQSLMGYKIIQVNVLIIFRDDREKE